MLFMEKIKFYLRWWFDYKLPFYVEREFDSSIVDTNLIAVLVGARRAGKSTLFYQLIDSYKEKIPASNIIYVNYEDDRLAPLEGKELSGLLNVFRQNYTYDENYPIYLFLDEIQNLPGWDKTVRRLYDTENVKIFITGSNSKLLSREISTALRGRTLSSKVNPLSFTEYLKFNNIPVPDLNDLRYSGQKDKIIFSFDKYLKYGGFPEVVRAENEQLQERILQEYMNTIFYSDIIERYEIRQFKVMDIYLKMLCRQTGSLFSFGKMQNLLKSLGFKVSKNTLIEYLSYMEEAFFGKSIMIFSYSIKDQLQYPRKFYLVDTGLFTATTFIKERDYGRLLENLVFNTLHSRYDTIAYWKDKRGYEVDFVLPDLLHTEGSFPLIQVCYDMKDEKTRKREIDNLVTAAKYFKVKTGLVITRDSWDEVVIDGIEIIEKPYFAWCSEETK